MPFPILAAVGVAVKTALMWLIKFIVKYLIIQIILIIIAYFAADLIHKLTEKIAEKIKENNNFILQNIFNIEDMLFRLQHNVYELLIRIWTELKEKIEAALDAFLPEKLEVIIKMMNLAAWIDTIISDIIEESKRIVYESVFTFTSPIANKLWDIINLINRIEYRIETETRKIYDGVVQSVQTQVDAFNAKIMNLFNQINSMVDFFNQSIFEIRAAIENNNGEIPQKNTQLISWILANKDSADFESDLSGKLDEIYTPIHIEWDKYVYTLTPDVNEYILQIEFPPFSFDISTLIPEIGQLRMELNQIRELLNNLPSDAADRFISLFPDFFKPILANRIRQILIIAITNALLLKKQEVEAFFSDFQGQLLKEMEEGKQKIIAETKEIIRKIEEFELNLVAKLPEILKPQLQKAVETLEKLIIEKQNEVIVNVDKYITDTSEVDHLLESFPKHLKAKPSPNKFDTADWTIQDMYRMLVNYFTREERIALITYLFSQDVEVSDADLASLFPNMEEPEYDESWGWTE